MSYRRPCLEIEDIIPHPLYLRSLSVDEEQSRSAEVNGELKLAQDLGDMDPEVKDHGPQTAGRLLGEFNNLTIDKDTTQGKVGQCSRKEDESSHGLSG